MAPIGENCTFCTKHSINMKIDNISDLLSKLSLDSETEDQLIFSIRYSSFINNFMKTVLYLIQDSLLKIGNTS